MIDRETQQKIKDAANIVDVVGDYVKLTRRGANYMGLCPFHNERTPSFSVSPSRNFCHCFSCGKGGSPVNFIMEKEGISYNEALLQLAKKYGITVQERELTEEERQRLSEREAMIVANEWAMNYFHDNLYNTAEGRDIGLSYLYSRGITDEAIRAFKIGYSIDKGNALLSKARKEGFDIEIFKSLGLVGTSQEGREYDRFRGRVMFPIRNSSGKTVAFGGRALKGEPAKYINSPESPIYRKSNELFGIFEAKAQILKKERVFLMEGYLDVIGSWQAGLQNAVASSGTALTENQIALIHRFTNNVTLIYDGDAAGIKASLRGIDMLLAQKLHVKVLLLPEGEDPDSYAKSHTPQEFFEYIENHETDFIRFKIDVLLKNSANNPQMLSEAVRSVVTSIACIPDEIERIAYIKECSRLMNIDEAVITNQVRQALISSQNRPRREQNDSFAGTNEKISDNNPSPIKSRAYPAQNDESSPYEKQEREIIKYCVRYAFLPLEDKETQPQEGGGEEEDDYTVLEFVKEELEFDDIEFTYPPYVALFNELISILPLFKREVEKYSAQLGKESEQSRDRFYESLRSEGGSMTALRKKETEFKQAEATLKQEKIRNFTANFSADFLINHENREIRETANALLAERHTLSAIYSRNGMKPKTEVDILYVLVPRALTELRSEILQKKVEYIQKKISDAITTNDTVTQKSLIEELSKLFQMRKSIAENLGDRTLSPRN